MFKPELLAKYPSLKKFNDLPEEDIVESHDGREKKLLDYIFNHAQLDSLRGHPLAIMAVMDEFAVHEDFLISIGVDKAGKIASLIREYRPHVLLELGGYVSYSALLFGSIMQEIHSENQNDTKPKIYSIEMDPVIASIAMKIISLAGLSDIVEVVVGASIDILQQFHDKGTFSQNRIDLLFLDHDESLYKSDLKLCEKLGLLQDGAVVVADNVVRPGAPEYREYMRQNEHVSKSWGLPALIWPGDFEDELEISIIGTKSTTDFA